ncbi:15601_t:CDS:2 [Gigaspora rosea]|nr:15601_t:CDS:2 [Gigaspora rosea]
MCEVGVQVNQETHEVGIQVSDITLESRVYLLQLQLSSKINEIEDLKKQLDYAYDYVMESWERVQELSKINKEITEQNNALKCKWETRYNSQKKRIDSVIQIANQERQNDLIDEKTQTTNIIDQSIKNQKGAAGQSKWCKKCNTTNIDNKKRTCPKCNEKLDTLAALQAESANELAQLNNTASQSKPLIINEKLKNFSDLACKRRIKFINETFKENRPNHSLRPIPVTAQEEAAAMDEANINRTQLQEILQNIRDLHNEQDEPEDEIELEN